MLFRSTTPYSPITFYQGANIANGLIDSFEQLNRRIITLHLTEDNYDDMKADLTKDDQIAEAIWKIKKSTNQIDNDKSND